MEFNIKNIKEKAIKLMSYEKIDSGIHAFTIESVEFTKTEKSNKDCIKYLGTVLNSKNVKQDLTVVESCANEESFSFALKNLIEIYEKVLNKKLNLDEINTIDEVKYLIKEMGNDLKGKQVKIEFIKTQLPDGTRITKKELKAG